MKHYPFIGRAMNRLRTIDDRAQQKFYSLLIGLEATQWQGRSTNTTSSAVPSGVANSTLSR